MKFFFDRCMSPKLCAMVAILDSRHTLVHHDKDGRFHQKTADIEWIDAISRDADQPTVVSGDCKILKRPDEVLALKASGLTIFCLDDHWPSLNINEMAWRFVKVWPEVVNASAVSEPTVFRIGCGKSLKVEQYCLTKNITR